ncbi:murein biosynthesis integral membrane protein MurJ [Clostridium saccharobutylicum]|uniref:Probable lipid II flippase MurJ n=1 Tax=Clostridium saccharobutylicum DSM 13864 TaxID=1345695 RepID=U5MNR2_CLOSA|nr:murein biosynthesis integral membrane protein MurJ [Clostridium saccharobutylicum]AGX42235.1 integral membrane protein MviN [Clostridium saccharobutylicum DSM 13864]AQR89516.1 putative peptidoglycan biosynthesis protein MurJ [Clostridium saccharobutylicum]AQR99418.1 putative peptidoglycan biosynthesis protein MurJ [Clostridium saccharobutylicum]AQS09149.1 putative peptidoglycan biosynthesis protein MurJ [Clostridium saccharobutylicum]AQS13404.1 putative peptidoglycan biosynthesis protein Mu
MKKGSTLVKSTFIIMIVSLISRVLGFVRDMLIAKNFGAGMYTDAYNIAVSVPEILFTLVGLAISTAFLPTLSKIKAKNGNEEMYGFANNVINILFVISFVFFIGTIIFSRQIVNIFDFSEETKLLAVRLLNITLLNLLFLSVNACFTALLQVNEDFVIPSILGLFFNLPMILYLVLFKNYDIVGLTIANVIGNFFRVAVQVPSLVKHGYKYKFIANFRDERLKVIVILILPVIVGAGANSLNMVVDTKIASSLPNGSVSALNYAQKLIIFINTIIVTSVTSVVYPVMANMRSNYDESGFINILKKSILYLAILLIPITAAIMIFSEEVVSVVYARGEFTQYAVHITTLSLLGYGLGIFFTGIRDVLNSTLFSMGKTKITTVNGVIGVIINVVLSITLSRYIGIIGIALASSIAMLVTSMLLLRSIIKLEKIFRIKDMIKKISLVILNSLIMGAVLYILGANLNGKLQPMVILIIGAIVGGIIYFVLCYMFKVEEIVEIKNAIMKKIRR